MSEGQKHLLIVDDETALREAIAERLADHGFIVEQAASGEQALERLADFAFDILDHRPAPARASTGGRCSRPRSNATPTSSPSSSPAYGTVKDAVDAIKQGAADFITKPFQFDALLHVLRSALEQRRLKSENAYLRSQLEERYRIDGLVGHSRVMRDLFAAARDRRGHVEHGPDHRRDRHREGARRARDPSQQPAARQPVRRDQLQRDSGNAARGGALRPRARRVHRRGGRRARDGSSRRTRARCSSTRSGR